jgi:hypothetical protein
MVWLPCRQGLFVFFGAYAALVSWLPMALAFFWFYGLLFGCLPTALGFP